MFIGYFKYDIFYNPIYSNLFEYKYPHIYINGTIRLNNSINIVGLII